MLSVDTLRQLLRLDHETGRLWWLPRSPEWFTATARRTAEHTAACWNARWAGTEALAVLLDDRGYRRGTLLGRDYLAHRVAFALANGRWPVGDVDHEDRDPGNNRPANLREATRSENLRNRVGTTATTSRYCGVSWCPQRGNWRATATLAGRYYALGRFADEADAARAYDVFAREHHGAFARLNFPEENRRAA